MGTVISQECWSAENRANTQSEANSPVGDGEASEVAHSPALVVYIPGVTGYPWDCSRSLAIEKQKERKAGRKALLI